MKKYSYFSYHSGNIKHLGTPVPGTQDKVEIYFYISHQVQRCSVKSKPNKDEKNNYKAHHKQITKKTVKIENDLNSRKRKRTQYKQRNKDKNYKRFYVRNYISKSMILIV